MLKIIKTDKIFKFHSPFFAFEWIPQSIFLPIYYFLFINLFNKTKNIFINKIIVKLFI
jgi:hypothetical protein